MNQRNKSHEAEYRICIAGHLSQSWSTWLDGVSMTIEPEGITNISANLDQPGLHAVLNRIRDLNLVLLSVERLEHK